MQPNGDQDILASAIDIAFNDRAVRPEIPIEQPQTSTSLMVPPRLPLLPAARGHQISSLPVDQPQRVSSLTPSQALFRPPFLSCDPAVQPMSASQSPLSPAESSACSGSAGSIPPVGSFVENVGRALLSSSKFSMHVTEIYAWFLENFNGLDPNSKKWNWSIRHCLSTNQCFVRAPGVDGKRGGTWALHPMVTNVFEDGRPLTSANLYVALRKTKRVWRSTHVDNLPDQRKRGQAFPLQTKTYGCFDSFCDGPWMTILFLDQFYAFSYGKVWLIYWSVASSVNFVKHIVFSSIKCFAKIWKVLLEIIFRIYYSRENASWNKSISFMLENRRDDK